MNEAERYASRLKREWLLGVAAATGLALFLTLAGVWRPMGDLLYDHLHRWRDIQPSPHIVLVSVDDRSIAELGGWPLRRQHYADLLEQLAQEAFPPRVVGMNLLFMDSHPDDARLASALRLHRAVLPVGFVDQTKIVQIAEPVEPLRDQVALGHIGVVFSADGSVRSLRTQDSGYTHLALVMHRLGQGDSPLRAPPLDHELRLPLPSPTNTFQTVSLADAVNGRVDLSIFHNAYVLLGVTSPSLGDRFATLYSGQFNTNTPGVVILASALQAALEQSFIEVGSVPWLVLLNLLGVWLVLLGVLWLRPLWALLLSLGMMLSWVGASAHMLGAWHLWLDPTPAVATALLFLPLWAWRRTTVMAHIVSQEAAALGRHSSGDSALPQKHAGEFVVRQAQLLAHAVDAANSELSLLSSVIEELPEAVAIVSVKQGLLLQNQKLAKLLAHAPLQRGESLQHVCMAVGLANTTLELHTSQILQLPTTVGMGEFMLKVSPVRLPRQGELWVLVLSDVTQLRQVQAQRDQALQFLSHDMRTPLASILTLVRQPEMPAYKIEQHAHKLLKIMDDFCVTVAADAPSYKLQPELLDLLLDDALERIADLAEAKHIAINLHNEADSIFVQANAQLLVRALTNLLQNAVKFAPLHSTVEVRVSWQAGTTSAEHWVRIQIVNAVERVHHDTTLPGFGLGLEFVEKVVAKHGGQMVRDIPQQGEARVTVALPCVDEGVT